ncbi:M3 family oligoendopeptidase [Clostridium senegalense]|uniref:M3 family oligoendopeptidase n=1 Tax=Clostridium senegalense TaxID=1465809 RepID=A0A6M0H4B1_9CLOT|nr:M3 family oligoendopeptidase [Clostridium senegalense]NEU05367.1 M3 family oligoendopeptidase [Clostridium senegalense]
MRFEDFEYKRVDIEEAKRKVLKLIKDFRNSDSYENQCFVIDEINEIRNEFISMKVICELRKYLGINKEFYSKEMEYYADAEPIMDGLICEYYKALDSSKFKKMLKCRYGNQLFDLAKMKMRCVSDEIIEELQEENKIMVDYFELFNKLKSRKKFDGKFIGICEFNEYINSDLREIRKSGYEAQTEIYIENENEIQNLFDKLVKVRNKMALKMGYENFIEMGYARMKRVGYDKNMVSNFRKQILKYVVPLNKELAKHQGKRIGVDKLKYYDEIIQFKNGNARLNIKEKDIIKKLQKVYEEISDETRKFFNYVVKNNLIDIENRENKECFAFCEYIFRYKSPFVFLVYNGVTEDFNSIIHELGHAFQLYLCRDYDIPEYIIPSEDVAEICSMSMEFLIEPWIDEFFDKDIEKYKFYHMVTQLYLLTYISIVDEFQHFVYEKPEATYEERNKIWRKLEMKYIPYRDYGKNDFLNKGGYWLRQAHIFVDPFYYIDYGLAQIVAFDFWHKSKLNSKKAWNDYTKVCEAGGSKSFLEIIKLGNLKNPFEEESIKYIIKCIREWILDIEEKLI